MCFNYALFSYKAAIEQRYGSFIDFDYRLNDRINGFEYPEAPVVVINNSKKVITAMNWGLIPHWVKSTTQAENIRKYNLNCRSETIFEKPSFKDPIIRKRAIIPANGFYEWQHIGKQKIMHFVGLKDINIFSFAAIYDIRIDTIAGETIKTFSIITKQADGFMSEIHNTKMRMPLILMPDEEDIWLDDIPQTTIIDLLRKGRDYKWQLKDNPVF